MRRLLMMLAASAFLALTLGSTAKADTLAASQPGQGPIGPFTDPPVKNCPAGSTCYTIPSLFPTNDSVHWGQLGANGTVVSSPFTVTSVNGLVITGDTANGGDVERLTECTVAGCDWNGNFAPGDALVWTNPNDAGTGNGALTITFPFGISGVGFQIQADSYGSFVGQLEIYDGTTELADIYEAGLSNDDQNNSAIFIGIVDPGADITSVKIGTFDCALNCRDFAINTLDLDTKAPTVPEPGTLMLLSSGFGVLGFLRRKLS